MNNFPKLLQPLSDQSPRSLEYDPSGPFPPIDYRFRDDPCVLSDQTVEYWNELISLNEKTQRAYKRIEEIEAKYADRPVPLRLTSAEYEEFLSAMNAIPRRFIIFKPGADTSGPLTWKGIPIEIV